MKKRVIFTILVGTILVSSANYATKTTYAENAQTQVFLGDIDKFMPNISEEDNDATTNSVYYESIGLYFDKSSGTITSFGENLPNKLVIPSVLDGTAVIRIGENAFNSCENLTSVTIPDSVLIIDNSAFSECLNLTEVTLSTQLNKIGENAFFCCESLKNINIPSSVTHIGNRAFFDTAWYNEQKDGVLYLNNWCLGYKGDMPENKEITIENGTKAISVGAFNYCGNLVKITLPDGLTHIGEDAFKWCDALTSINLPKSITDIDSSAFFYCSGLKEITIPQGVLKLSDYTFAYCTGLTKVTIPSNISEIGNNAFSYCENLKNVIIENGVTSLNKYAFEYCKSMTDITIPKSVTNIGNGAFFSCDGLKDVYYTGTQDEWQQIDVNSLNEALTDAVLHCSSQNETIKTLDVIGDYSDKITVECKTDDDNITITITPKEGDISELTNIKLFVAGYTSEQNTLDSLTVGINSIANNKLTITAETPNSENYKIMLWDENLAPITPITKK